MILIWYLMLMQGSVLNLADLLKQFYDNWIRCKTAQFKAPVIKGNDATKTYTSIIDGVKPRLRAKYGEQEYNLSMKQLECFHSDYVLFFLNINYLHAPQDLPTRSFTLAKWFKSRNSHNVKANKEEMSIYHIYWLNTIQSEITGALLLFDTGVVWKHWSKDAVRNLWCTQTV